MKQTIKKTLSMFLRTLLIIFTVTGCGSENDAAFSDNETESGRKTITVNGTDYFPRQDITVVLLMGIDTTGEMVDSGSYNNDGESDVVALLVFNEESETFSVININRDAMVNMPVLGLGGKKAGTAYQQLALAHTYGTGLEDSCENTKETVSALINNVYIDYYVAVNMSAISIVNDAVDGVTVEITDDFSQKDEQLPLGEVTLMGDQAVNFIRLRKGVGDQLNISRMERHKSYASGFLKAFRQKMDQGETFALSLYETISPYIVTDCSVTVLTSMMERYADYEIVEIVSPEGENVMGEEYFEFYVDEQKLDQLILRLFYEAK